MVLTHTHLLPQLLLLGIATSTAASLTLTLLPSSTIVVGGQIDRIAGTCANCTSTYTSYGSTSSTSTRNCTVCTGRSS